MDIANFFGALHGAVAQGVIWSIMTLGVYITFRILDFPDMTVDGSFATGGSVAAMLVGLHGVNPFVALLAAMGAGMLCGFITGFLTTKMKIPGILAGILTMTALYSINIRVMGGAMVPLNGVDTVDTIVRHWIPSLSPKNCQLLLGGILAAAIIVLLYWFFGTELGSSIRATGNNPYMVRSLGVNTDSMTMIALVISNGLVALSGGLFAQVQGSASVDMGVGTIVIGLASVIIGEVVLGRRVSFMLRLICMVLGSIIYRAVIAIVLFFGLRSTDMKLITAIIVAVALFVPKVKKDVTRWNAIRREKQEPVPVPDGTDGLYKANKPDERE
ncbi:MULTISPECIES: ABC transporter permease [Caproicibacterium]|mgnify:CR=1 FL=1|jgi:putative ABC transport system permease protein|uniref:ABC transporter permease n=1 Tax=Caproicibacterium lactatifermentans TaxID=2666138 RepID=A0A859DNP3_9FIRM|nr:ABC transporter permease [Caproicibacterium lactatifermentans]ARP50639.1 ABC transporter permease [Ruminococcaceae bacterium CPB6]MDD4808295.1 ABC transporter permease [Oscillospiraceae bacterium]QKN23627.1 ABC transporter permease [Caproicibacterium lactatifermentans]